MAFHTSSIAVLLTSLVLPLFIPSFYSFGVFANTAPTKKYSDEDNVQFAENFEYLEGEFFLCGSTGRGMDAIATELAQGGPPPIGCQMVNNMDPLIKDVMYQFGLQRVGHIRAIKREAKGIRRPLLNISKETFARVVDEAFGRRLNPPFDPYVNALNFVLGAYIVSVTPHAYVGISPLLQNGTFKKLVAGLLGVDAGQDAVIRGYLYKRQNMTVAPYRSITVAEFTNRISDLANRLGEEGTRSEGIVVPPSEGAEGRVSGNLIDGDRDSLFYGRTPEGLSKIIRADPNGFFPRGGNGRIANT